eukprot:GFUD01011970.1.p1 GENE.GFUD01011970.1~~GFUD01011970.1.p1  ORF type:complete len:636 (-),score=156.99 GFUD01011970.1:106-2013(-)
MSLHCHIFTLILLALGSVRIKGFKLGKATDTNSDITTEVFDDDSTDNPNKVEATTTSIVTFGGGIIFENGVLKRYTTTSATTEAITETTETNTETTAETTETTTETTEKTTEITETTAVDDVTTEMVKEFDSRIVNTDVDTSFVFGTTGDAVNFEKVVSQLTTEPIPTTENTHHEHQHDKHEYADHLNTSRTEVVVEHYHDHVHLVEFINILEKEFPKIVTKYKIGSSVEGRDILALKITSEAGKKERPLGIPMIKYVANMHGDESVGREMLVGLAEHLVKNYGVIERITKLIDTTEIHLLPTMNPDGFERVTRGNFNGVDLNRGFPGQESLSIEREELFEDREKEVVSVMKWILDNPFVASINFHDGAVVANYPYDEKSLQPWKKTSLFRDHHNTDVSKLKLTPDNEEFVRLASLYSANHRTMHNGNHSCEKFDRGITNGADWYEIKGGMQDFNYLYTNCMEITLELSCVKKPKAYMLQAEWENNREALVAYLETARGAVHGVVTDQEGNTVDRARIEVIGRAKDVLTTERGEYWRVLAPGKHKVRAVLGDLQSDEVEVEINDDWTSEVGPKVDLQIKIPLARIVTTTTTTTTTITTTTTTEDPGPEGTNLYILPGVCLNLSLVGIRGCKERGG